MFDKLAHISFRYAKWIAAIWIILLASSIHYADELPGVLGGPGLNIKDGSYERVQTILSTEFHIPADPVVVWFENSGSASERQFRDYIRTVLDKVRGTEGLLGIRSPLEYAGMEDRRTAYALLTFQQPSHELTPVIAKLRHLLPQRQDMSAVLTGKPVVQADVNSASERDLKRAELLGIPAALLVLRLAFGSFAAAALPIAVGLTAVTSAMAVMRGLGERVELSIFVLNVIPMVGLAISIDFALMIVSRFREELRFRHPQQALAATLHTAGKAAALSAACVMVGLCGIIPIGLPMFTSVAVGALVVTSFSLLLALTLLPALLALASCRLKSRHTEFTLAGGRLWQLLAYFVMRRPAQMIVLAVSIMAVCLIPLDRMSVAVPDASSLPRNYLSRTASEGLEQHFASSFMPTVYLIADSGVSGWTKDALTVASSEVHRLEHDPLVERVDSVFTASGSSPDRIVQAIDRSHQPTGTYISGGSMLIAVTLKADADASASQQWVRRWEPSSSRLQWIVGGEAKYRQEIFDRLRETLPSAALFIFAANFTILFVAFRSVLIPLKTLLMNTLSLGASFGILVWLFQDGRLGLEPTPIAIMIPVFIFGLVFGVSMDYGILLLSRIAEAYRGTSDNERSVSEGLVSASGIVSSAAAIMISVTAPFVTADVSGIKQLGVGISAAILIDATVVRMLLVPSFMKVLGSWNWWPGSRR